MSIDYYDRNGDRLPEFWLTEPNLRETSKTDHRVAVTRIGLVLVSTVWLGLDHNHGYGPPMLFETMLFCDDSDDPRNHCLTRYSSEEAALRGHLAAVDALREGRELDWWAS